MTRRLAEGLGIRGDDRADDERARRDDGADTDGELSFQDYFVRRQQQDEVTGVGFAGIEQRPSPAGARCDRFGRSDRVLSVESDRQYWTVAGLAGVTSGGRVESRPRVAVSPIIAGKALKGPADKMLHSLGYEASAVGVATIFRSTIDGYVLDEQDADSFLRSRRWELLCGRCKRSWAVRKIARGWVAR